MIGLIGNLVISGTIKAVTGLHIGSSPDTVEIGGIDSPVIKHPLSGEPYIPGSSLKGRMRNFIEKLTAAKDGSFEFNRDSGRSHNPIWQHVCDDEDYSYQVGDNKGARNCPVCRVYGSTGKKGSKNHPARIVVRDCKLTNSSALKKDGLLIYEAKMENSIDRITAAAQPRTFERVPSDAEFGFEIIYKVQGEFENSSGKYQLKDSEIKYIQQDVQNIFEALSLIGKDGLGGSVSRGYGKVEFTFTKNNCKYFKVKGGDKEFLPTTDIESLRKSEFSNLDRSFLES